MRRTQIYLSAEQQQKLDAIATHQGTTRSALLRMGAEWVIHSHPLHGQESMMDVIARQNPQALRYVRSDMPEWKKAVLGIAGMRAEKDVCASDVICDLRKEADNRLDAQFGA